MLVLETGMLGALVALDLFLFYVFWEVMLVPMVLLIGVWGGPRRVYAAVKFVLFTMVGSLPMLVAILYCAWRTKAAAARSASTTSASWRCRSRRREQLWLLRGLRARVRHQGAALPAAHLAARRARRGADRRLGHPRRRPPQDGDVRLPPLRAAALPARRRTRRRRCIVGARRGRHRLRRAGRDRAAGPEEAGRVLVGVAPGLRACSGSSRSRRPRSSGSVYQMLNHGLSTGALFLLVGMIYERRHTRQIADFGGLWSGRAGLLGRASCSPCSRRRACRA